LVGGGDILIDMAYHQSSCENIWPGFGMGRFRFLTNGRPYSFDWKKATELE
jgi:hypothetical protein